MHQLINLNVQSKLDHDLNAEPVGEPEVYDATTDAVADGGASAEEPIE